MRKDVVYLAVIVILLGMVVVLTCTKPDPYDKEAFLYQDSIKTLQAGKRILSASIDSLVKTSNHKAKVSDSLVEAKDREISRLKVKASQARTPKVDTLILDNPELKVFVEAQDSVILTQSVLIDTLKAQVEFERMTREQLVGLHYSQSKIESQLTELAQSRIIDLEKSLKKSQRRNRGLKALAVIGTVLGVLVGSNL